MARDFSRNDLDNGLNYRSPHSVRTADQRTSQEEAPSTEPHRRTSTEEKPLAEPDQRLSPVSSDQVASPPFRRTFVPIDSPPGHPTLNFKPVVLKAWALIMALLFFGAVFTLLVLAIVNYRSRPKIFFVRSLANYVALGTLPPIIGTVTTIWWRAINQTYNRTIPYISMSRSPTSVSVADSDHFETLSSVGALQMAQPGGIYLFKLVKAGHLLLVLTALTTIIVPLLLTPAKNGLFNLIEAPGGGWTVRLSIHTAGFCASLYGLLFICSLSILIRMWPSYTGLKWDPSPIAAQISLIHGSNVARAFQGLETCSHIGVDRHLATLGHDHGIARLGYWQDTADKTNIFYGIRFMEPHPGSATDMISPDFGDEAQAHVEVSQSPWAVEQLQSARYRVVLVNLSDGFLLFMFLLDVGLIAASIVAISKGYLKPEANFATVISEPADGSGWINGGLTLTFTKFFYRTGVAILLTIFGMIYGPADLFYRRMQPFAGMALPKLADENVLLDYLGPNGAEVLLTSLKNGHWRVAVFSIVVKYHQFTPIFASKAFIFVREGNTTIVKGVASWFYVCLATLVLNLFLILYARPPWCYRMPRYIQSIVDVISFCAESRLIDGPEFNIQDPTDEEIHFRSRVYLQKNYYLFGLYRGKDGQKHLGFDVSERQVGDQVFRTDMVDPGVSYWKIWRPRSDREPRLALVDEDLEREVKAVPRFGSLSSKKLRKLLNDNVAAEPRSHDVETATETMVDATWNPFDANAANHQAEDE